MEAVSHSFWCGPLEPAVVHVTGCTRLVRFFFLFFFLLFLYLPLMSPPTFLSTRQQIRLWEQRRRNSLWEKSYKKRFKYFSISSIGGCIKPLRFMCTVGAGGRAGHCHFLFLLLYLHSYRLNNRSVISRPRAHLGEWWASKTNPITNPTQNFKLISRYLNSIVGSENF